MRSPRHYLNVLLANIWPLWLFSRVLRGTWLHITSRLSHDLLLLSREDNFLLNPQLKLRLQVFVERIEHVLIIVVLDLLLDQGDFLHKHQVCSDRHSGVRLSSNGVQLLIKIVKDVNIVMIGVKHLFHLEF